MTDRLVDCPPLKRALESFYVTILPKNSHPFVYLSLVIDASNIDVNVHPTKNEVHFLEEEEIIELICEALGNALASGGSSRSYAIQVRS